MYNVSPTNHSTLQTNMALGKVTLIDQGNNQYSIAADRYDFNIEWNRGFTKRNVATFGAAILHYGALPGMLVYPVVPSTAGGPYWLRLQGTVTINP